MSLLLPFEIGMMKTLHIDVKVRKLHLKLLLHTMSSDLIFATIEQLTEDFFYALHRQLVKVVPPYLGDLRIIRHKSQHLDEVILPCWDVINTCEQSAISTASLARGRTAFEGDTPKSPPKGRSSGRFLVHSVTQPYSNIFIGKIHHFSCRDSNLERRTEHYDIYSLNVYKMRSTMASQLLCSQGCVVYSY